MISHELAQIWITSDGKRFLTKDEAVKHEESIQPVRLKSQTRVFHPEYGDVTKWLDRLKGE
tara:strand:- start:316 stop:498 length:183 start_codon:yes stop_codon:yes gene_type:complete